MSASIVAAVVSAILGAVVGGISTYLISKPQTDALRRQVQVMVEQGEVMQRQLQFVQDQASSQAEREMQDEFNSRVDPVLQIAAQLVAPTILSSSPSETRHLYRKWESESKFLYVLGGRYGFAYHTLNEVIRRFYDELHAYASGETHDGKPVVSLEDAEKSRQTAADMLRALTPVIRDAARAEDPARP
jgi:hypothetical protein